MLLFNYTRGVVSGEEVVAPGYVINQEGRALVNVNGLGVKESAGTAGEMFVGVSINQLYTVSQLPMIEELTQSASNTITLSKTPVAGTIRITDQATGTVQAFNVAVGVNQYNITGTTVTLNAAQVGHKYTVSYRTNVTVAEAVAKYGNVLPGGPAGAYYGQVGVIKSGKVFTTEFDTAVDWAGATAVTLGANGLFTVGGSGAVLSNVRIVQLPSADSTALGIEIL